MHMLNQTSNLQVHPIIKGFFDKYPTPIAALTANVNDLASDIKWLGLQNRKAKNIQNFSHDWLYTDWEKISDYRGIGKYASGSYEIFIKKNLNVQPTDKVLIGYLEKQNERKNTRNTGQFRRKFRYLG